MDPNLTSPDADNASTISDKFQPSELSIDDPEFKIIEGQVLKKFDYIIIPCICLCYFFSNLDKSNIGNAEAAGMSDDLGLQGNQYGNAVSLLFVTYVVFETPFALILKYFGIKLLLTSLMLFFGIVCLCTSFVSGYHSLLACRMLLGFFESGIMPIINVYLGMLYTRQEMAKRCSVVFSAAALAGAFGGLLAYGLIKIDVNGWEGWRWLFAIEGALTIISCPVLFILLPNQLSTVWWLNEKERQVLKIRLTEYPEFYQDEKFTWSEVRRSLLDINNICICCYEFCADLTLFGISTFLPSIIKGMGYNKYETQLLTIPFYAIALISFVIVGYLSDKYRHRGGFLLGGLTFNLIGYIILICSDVLGARYFGCMMIGIGIYVCSALSIMWINNNNAGHYKRATMGGMITSVGSCAGVLAGQIYKSKTAPRYFKGLKIAMSLTCVGFPLVLIPMWNYNRMNKKRAQLLAEKNETGEFENPKDDRDIHFRFLL
uniref:MFS transporter n=1 Tax=Cyberlindnera americana TaxID=36016 RepID=A0A5P8N8F1_9ASCO|nr:MFS transporter [Cyberlindnera americana]